MISIPQQTVTGEITFDDHSVYKRCELATVIDLWNNNNSDDPLKEALLLRRLMDIGMTSVPIMESCVADVISTQPPKGAMTLRAWKAVYETLIPIEALCWLCRVVMAIHETSHIHGDVTVDTVWVDGSIVYITEMDVSARYDYISVKHELWNVWKCVFFGVYGYEYNDCIYGLNGVQSVDDDRVSQLYHKVINQWFEVLQCDQPIDITYGVKAIEHLCEQVSLTRGVEYHGCSIHGPSGMVTMDSYKKMERTVRVLSLDEIITLVLAIKGESPVGKPWWEHGTQLCPTAMIETDVTTTMTTVSMLQRDMVDIAQKWIHTKRIRQNKPEYTSYVCGTIGGLYTLQMRRVVGMDLYEYCTTTPYTIARIPSLAIVHTAEVMELLHTYGLCHNDISLENVMYDVNTRKGTLIDFGLARCSNSRIPKCGKPYSLPPESGLVISKEWLVDIHKARDIWSLGTMLYALVFVEPFDFSSEPICGYMTIRGLLLRYCTESAHRTLLDETLSDEQEKMVVDWLQNNTNNINTLQTQLELPESTWKVLKRILNRWQNNNDNISVWLHQIGVPTQPVKAFRRRLLRVHRQSRSWKDYVKNVPGKIIAILVELLQYDPLGRPTSKRTLYLVHKWYDLWQAWVQQITKTITKSVTTGNITGNNKSP